jgi:Listeria-Bacteroides repeat domain (List_Bact_rpt).
MINPQSFDVAYSLGWDVDDDVFAEKPTASPSASDSTHLAFSFTLNPEYAERKTIAFSLGKYVASINKAYDKESFSVVCESPPDPPPRAVALPDKGQKSLLAIMLPTGAADTNLAKLAIAWTCGENSSLDGSGSYDISSLASAPSSSPFSSKYDCYFQGTEIQAGYSYSYSVNTINADGLASQAIAASSDANKFYVNYYGNGNESGSAPEAAAYRYNEVAKIASSASLAKTDYAFYAWNTAADGSGTSYSPADSLTIPAGETNLYAIWITNTTAISFDLGTQALSFSPIAASAQAGATLSVSCANSSLVSGGSNWTWYLDGVKQNGQTSSAFNWTTGAADIGQHIISCAVTYNGLLYSGFFRAVVKQ